MLVVANTVQSFAQTIGSMIGSQLIPTYLPETRRRRLLAGLTSVLLLFIPAFAVVLHMFPGPDAFIPLVFILFTHGGCVALSERCVCFVLRRLSCAHACLSALCLANLSAGSAAAALLSLRPILFFCRYVNSSVFSLAYDKLDSAPDDRRTLQVGGRLGVHRCAYMLTSRGL